MPYTAKQCRMFYAKKKRGEKVPADFEKHCGKSKTILHGGKNK